METTKLNIHDLETIAFTSNLLVQLEEEFRPFFNEINEDFNLVAGHIYSSADLVKLGLEKRPAFEKNLFVPIIASIIGNFKNNIPALDYYGRTPKDQETADFIKAVQSWIFYQQNDIEKVLSRAFLFATIGRRTFIKHDYGFKKNPSGGIEIDHHHPFIKYDTALTNGDLSTCQFMSDELWLTPDEIKRVYAANNKELANAIDEKVTDMFGDSTRDKKGSIRNYLEKLAGMISDYVGEKKGYDTNYYWNKNSESFDKDGLWHRDGRFKVSDFYHRVLENKMLITDRVAQKTMDFTKYVKRDRPAAQGETWYDNDKLQMIRSQLLDDSAYIEDTFEPKIYQTSIVPGMQIKLFDGPQLLQNGNFKFVKVESYDWHPDPLETKSVVDNIKDAVKSYNQRDNTNLTYLMRQALGEHWVSDKFRNKVPDLVSNKIGAIKFVPEEILTERGHKKLDPPPPHNALERYMQQQLDEIYTISSERPNSMGGSEGERSGKLFEARVQQSDISKEYIFENGIEPYKILAFNNLYYMKNYMKEEIIMRIADDNGNPSFEVLNQQDGLGNILNNLQDIGEFDIEVSKAPYGKIAKENERERNLELLQITTGIPEFLPVSMMLFKDILKNTTVEDKAQKLQVTDAIIKKMLDQILAPVGASPMEEKAMQIELEGKVLQNQKTAAETEKVLLENAQTQMVLDDGVALAEEQAAGSMISNIFSITGNKNKSPMVGNTQQPKRTPEQPATSARASAGI